MLLVPRTRRLAVPFGLFTMVIGVDRLAFTLQRLSLGPDARFKGRYMRTECRRGSAARRVECNEVRPAEL
jgi:hypothetical protein